MPIAKIVLKVLTSNENAFKPDPIELGPDQGALIPAVGDRLLAPSFSMDVMLRKFEFDGDVLYVFLADTVRG
jgi:hypothetical protein